MKSGVNNYLTIAHNSFKKVLSQNFVSEEPKIGVSTLIAGPGWGPWSKTSMGQKEECDQTFVQTLSSSSRSLLPTTQGHLAPNCLELYTSSSGHFIKLTDQRLRIAWLLHHCSPDFPSSPRSSLLCGIPPLPSSEWPAFVYDLTHIRIINV